MAPIANFKLRMCIQHAKVAASIKDKNTGKPLIAEPIKGTRKFPRGLEEWIDVPDTWRTNMCGNLSRGIPCKFGHTCAFAHTPKDLRHKSDPLPPLVFVPRIGEPMEPPVIEPEQKPELKSLRHGSAGKTEPEVATTALKAAALNDKQEDCLICRDLVADAILIPCGHKMCQGCVQRWRANTVMQKSSGTPCPFCRLTVSSVEPLTNISDEAKPAISAWAKPDSKASVMEWQEAKSKSQLALERAEQRQREDRERIERERVEKERLESERVAKERLENERVERAAAERLEREQWEAAQREREEEAHRKAINLSMQESFKASQASSYGLDHAPDTSVTQKRSAFMPPPGFAAPQLAMPAVNSNWAPPPPLHSTPHMDRWSPMWGAGGDSDRSAARYSSSAPTTPSGSGAQASHLFSASYGFPSDAPHPLSSQDLAHAMPSSLGFNTGPYSYHRAPGLSSIPGAAAGGAPVQSSNFTSSHNQQVPLSAQAAPMSQTPASSEEEQERHIKLRARQAKLALAQSHEAKFRSSAAAEFSVLNKDSLGLSEYELELAKKEAIRLEQEHQDALLALKFQKEEEEAARGNRLVAAAPPSASAAPAVAQQPLPKSSTTGKWECPVCTLLNDPSFATCSLCMCQRPR